MKNQQQHRETRHGPTSLWNKRFQQLYTKVIISVRRFGVRIYTHPELATRTLHPRLYRPPPPPRKWGAARYGSLRFVDARYTVRLRFYLEKGDPRAQLAVGPLQCASRERGGTPFVPRQFVDLQIPRSSEAFCSSLSALLIYGASSLHGNRQTSAFGQSKSKACFSFLSRLPCVRTQPSEPVQYLFSMLKTLHHE